MSVKYLHVDVAGIGRQYAAGKYVQPDPALTSQYASYGLSPPAPSESIQYRPSLNADHDAVTLPVRKYVPEFVRRSRQDVGYFFAFAEVKYAHELPSEAQFG
ncbi:MAG: hypothetical protein QMC36_02905 [Patescibacteria group bacterium]